MNEERWTADILVVDDTVENLELLVSSLSAHGYKVRPVTGGEAALRAARSVLPDLILLDIRMPDIDGYEVCRRLKADPRTGGVPVLFVTALGDEDDEAKGLELGAVDYITKPINPSILCARVKNHLELKLKSDLLEELASMDSLTCLANRRRFEEVFEKEWRRADRYDKPISLIMLDVDFFKAYNDHYGHVLGDECLRLVGQTLLRSTRRGGDLAARYGGEEFVVLLPETDLDGALEVARILHAEIGALNITHARSTVSDRVTVSIGIAGTSPNADTSRDTFLNTADQALYEAKKNGRNQVWTATSPDALPIITACSRTEENKGE